MPKRRYRVAIVGCGKIAGGYDIPRSKSRGKVRTHVKAYRSDRRFEVVAVCDQNLSKARRFCRHWKIPAAYRNLEAMLLRERPDVVSVCAPTAAHRTILESIARRRVRLVFAEKPFTANVRDARIALRKLKAARVAVAVNYLRRWCPNHQRIKQIIESGRLGRLRSLDAVYSGDLMNIGSHLIDLIRYLAGEITSVCGEQLTLKNGAAGFLEHSDRDRFVLELLFEHGLVRIIRYGYAGECLVWRGKKAKVLFQFRPPGRGIDSAMKHAVGNVGDHLSRSARILSDGRNALGVLAVCEALRASAKSRKKTRC